MARSSKPVTLSDSDGCHNDVHTLRSSKNAIPAHIGVRVEKTAHERHDQRYLQSPRGVGAVRAGGHERRSSTRRVPDVLQSDDIRFHLQDRLWFHLVPALQTRLDPLPALDRAKAMAPAALWFAWASKAKRGSRSRSTTCTSDGACSALSSSCEGCPYGSAASRRTDRQRRLKRRALGLFFSDNQACGPGSRPTLADRAVCEAARPLQLRVHAARALPQRCR